jgi:hypothetical protein
MGKVESIRWAPPRGAPPRRSSSDAARDGGPPLPQLAAGLQNKEVAQKLNLSLATVRNHGHNILVKLGVHSKLEAVSLHEGLP